MFDIGVNLTNKQFSHDHSEVINRAKVAGVNGMLITGTSVSASQKAVSLAKRYSGYCWATAGVHPHDAKQWTEETQQSLHQLLIQPEVVAVGECGLDFDRNFSTPQEQERAFLAQLELACELKKPLFLHCRDAYSRFISLLKPYLSSLSGAVVHCFTDERSALDHYLELGLYIGITGWICDERRGQTLRQLVNLIPSEQLLLETDAPFLLPRDLQHKPQSRRNEPCFLAHIIQQVALLRNEDPNVLSDYTEMNACKLFNLD